MEEYVEIMCPYCGESNELFIDYSGGKRQTYYEDCRICCQPWQVDVTILNETPSVRIRRAE
ncbi:MAG: CPXCG motif-containing cysteine-rich protein [Candidatus Marinimicrobia bacterium]|nr:CPXCG motif-containing cysteine-rich protein [Candidatus Neomarinimicrobiota bacterium]MCF7828118.1 CPXCG motif-containing cysteine-rich protein [Candidatus Neomarinimicrobiota bacterium]MCF7879707.1 CPXCG motif-containing cysteine-rich protein [Candidatus Neomarinimicrobiota bacterium]